MKSIQPSASMRRSAPSTRQRERPFARTSIRKPSRNSSARKVCCSWSSIPTANPSTTSRKMPTAGRRGTAPASGGAGMRRSMNWWPSTPKQARSFGESRARSCPCHWVLTGRMSFTTTARLWYVSNMARARDYGERPSNAASLSPPAGRLR